MVTRSPRAAPELPAAAGPPVESRPGKLDVARVTPADLAHIDDFLKLLRALDDPLVSTEHLCAHVVAIPVLATRCIHRASSARCPIQSLGPALGRIGNHGLETVLLEVLEDLTILKAELEG